MQKFIELLNEYGEERYNHWGNYQTDMDFTDRETYWYLSKKFGFIKWLVNNDKIDLDEIPYLTDEHGGGFDECEEVIMILAISDTPIEDLISYFK